MFKDVQILKLQKGGVKSTTCDFSVMDISCSQESRTGVQEKSTRFINLGIGLLSVIQQVVIFAKNGLTFGNSLSVLKNGLTAIFFLKEKTILSRSHQITGIGKKETGFQKKLEQTKLNTCVNGLKSKDKQTQTLNSVKVLKDTSASLKSSTLKCMTSKGAFVLFASSLSVQLIDSLKKFVDLPLIIVTQLERLGGCFVQSAIHLSAASKIQSNYSTKLSTI